MPPTNQASDFTITKFEMNEPRNIYTKRARVHAALFQGKWTIYRQMRVDHDMPALLDHCDSFEEALILSRQRSAELIAMGMDDGYCADCSCPLGYHTHDGLGCKGGYYSIPRVCTCKGYRIKEAK